MPVTPEGEGPITVGETIPNQEIQYVLAVARKELEALLEQRLAILTRIGALRRTIASLVDTFGGAAQDEERIRIKPRTVEARQKGLTEACRAILIQSSEPLTVMGVAQRIHSSNPAVLSNHKNSVSSVATILRRLHSYGETTSILNRSGRRVWAWRRSTHEATPAVPSGN
ncbi:MAG: hypothetical protein LAO09_00635 [Acidobacteriia bacterium]|nr:hypothetical protein [Terriglobia bacterium]